MFTNDSTVLEADLAVKDDLPVPQGPRIVAFHPTDTVDNGYGEHPHVEAM